MQANLHINCHIHYVSFNITITKSCEIGAWQQVYSNCHAGLHIYRIMHACMRYGFGRLLTVGSCAHSLLTCRHLDSKETYILPTFWLHGCSSPPQGESAWSCCWTSASLLPWGGLHEWSIRSKHWQDKFLCYQVVYMSREQSATFHDHRSNWEFIWRIMDLLIPSL